MLQFPTEKSIEAVRFELMMNVIGIILRFELYLHKLFSYNLGYDLPISWRVNRPILVDRQPRNTTCLR